MKFVYGKQDFKTLERGQENCYLLTNGLGGFSSVTVIGSAARNDPAFFMACTKAPNHRGHGISLQPGVCRRKGTGRRIPPPVLLSVRGLPRVDVPHGRSRG